jgi:ssDNA-binding Zn-finger/Zn-ribbon topoisomerase 1
MERKCPKCGKSMIVESSTPDGGKTLKCQNPQCAYVEIVDGRGAKLLLGEVSDPVVGKLLVE